MITQKLTLGESLVATGAASAFRPIKAPRLVRSVLKTVATAAVLVLAARELDGWLSIALWALAVLRVTPWLFIGVGQRVVDERKARLATLHPIDRRTMTTSTRLVGGRRGAA